LRAGEQPNEVDLVDDLDAVVLGCHVRGLRTFAETP
jgi:hypothetical protein